MTNGGLLDRRNPADTPVSPVVQEADEQLRLECARLAVLFTEGDPVENARKLYLFIHRMSHAEVVDLLRARCRGKQSALADEAGVSEACVSRVMKGGQVPPKLLKLIGYQRVTWTTYEPV